MVVGDPSVFAIESSITQAYERLSQRALGFFIIYLGSKSYGVRTPEASLLACSYDAVQARISRRGMHRVVFGSEPNAEKIVDAYLAARFDPERDNEIFFGVSADEFENAIISNGIDWAPDGDEAFDDGSHVLQFDQGNMVRLIAFKNANNHEEVARTLTEVWINADEFYDLLEKWKCQFETERNMILKQKGA